MSSPISPLISADHLKEIVDDDGIGIVDCRFSLDDTDRGRQDWESGRIPGARYAHLDDDLSAPLGDGAAGRHPMPEPAAIASLRHRWGFDEETLIVCYDDAGGAFAARLWWMLRWIGHEAVVVLDGGWPAWKAAKGPNDQAAPEALPLSRSPSSATWTEQAGWVAKAEDMERTDRQPVDARARERFRGEEEPIDPVAGHIPGAVNMPWKDNLDEEGFLLSPDVLRARWDAAGGTEQAVSYCGSGVTACHNVLAAAVAGLPIPRLFPPSWSGWIADPSRPIE